MSTTALQIEYLDRFREHVGPQYDWRGRDTYHDFDYGRTRLGENYDFEFLVRDHDLREKLRREYAYAIPTQEALEAIAAHGPVVEVGAGSGYWAMLLSQLTDVVAYDTGDWRFDRKWFPVWEAGPEIVDRHSDRTIFLCWPCYDDPMAADCLRRYCGDTIAYIGESDGGCTADDEFFKLLDVGGWYDQQTVYIPQWNHIHDYLSIWKRL